MKAKLFFCCLSFGFLLLACNSNAPKKRKHRVESKYPYAMLMPEDSLPAPKKQFVAQKKAEIDAFINENFLPEDNLAFLVAKNGHIIYERYQGLWDREKQISISETTPIHIASVTKVFTASIILKLIEAKKITLDQKVTTLLDSFPYSEVTIRSLLNHRSGLKKYNYFCDDAHIWGRNKSLTNDKLYEVLVTKHIPQETKTGTHFSYNNTNYALLALIIEKVTGMKYAKAVEELIFKPLEMKDSYVADENTPTDKFAPTYRANYSKFPIDFLDFVYGDKNIYSTPRDLLKFDIARNGKEFLSPQLLKEVYKGYSYENKGVKNYGLGIRLREWETGEKIFYHNGWWHGNTAVYVPMKNDNTTIIALSNRFNRKVFQTKRLITLFGKYPISLKDSVVVKEE